MAPAKINLHLEVLGLRSDGYHELAMLMQSIDLVDRLRLRRRDDGRLRLRCDRDDLPVDGDNLVLRAAEALRRYAGDPHLGAEIELEKRIPVGAGLAGGSSDAAAALVGLDALWRLALSPAELHRLGAELGSDVPFCLEGGSRLCFGRGERLEPPDPFPAALAVLLIKHPGTSVSTPWAYRRCRELRGTTYLGGEEAFEQRRRALRRAPLLQALAAAAPPPPLRNDLQELVAAEEPAVAEGLALLGRCSGALAVAMSGSGPSLFALFDDADAAARARREIDAELRSAGFGSWLCRFRPCGVSLEAAGPAA